MWQELGLGSSLSKCLLVELYSLRDLEGSNHFVKHCRTGCSARLLGQEVKQALLANPFDSTVRTSKGMFLGGTHLFCGF